ncbi:MAG: S-methyl-5-thioribose-1-phosphate isomerase [Anaerolineales bacterium]|nr:MAG: S-methyl-5-thioribose-1-phosphate isomerase [Anaerolineales bacterium]
MSSFHTIKWLDSGLVSMIDQRKLPHEVIYNEYKDPAAVAGAIRDMVIRGAPAIGAAAAFGLALVSWYTKSNNLEEVKTELVDAAEILRQARPTAVNLFWAINRIMDLVEQTPVSTVLELRDLVLKEALLVAEEDVIINQSLGKNAQTLIPDEAVIIHHCNTGSLAAVDYGTALGVIRLAHEGGKKVFVYVDETRPRLQGARLTAWELQQYGVPFKVITDSASGFYMQTQKIDLCIVGTDRVASNGDVANKIGTYNLAVVAHENQIPFYVAVPKSTIDMDTPSGAQIKIEERPAEEVTHVGTWQITPDNTPVGNPAFDITPAKYITAFITEDGIVYPPYEENLAKLFK